MARPHSNLAVKSSQVGSDSLSKDMQVLSSELAKSAPNMSLIRDLTGRYKIPFEKDPVKQIDFVLKFLNSNRFRKQTATEV